jgi:hypothetical protein
MPTLIPYSHLSSFQRSRAASLFHDDLFGCVPEDYIYGVDAATDQLTGARTRVRMIAREKGRKITEVRLMSTGPLRLTPAQARGLVRLFCKFD